MPDLPRVPEQGCDDRALIRVIAVKPVLIGVDGCIGSIDPVEVADTGKFACGGSRYRLWMFRQSGAAQKLNACGWQ
ncbi:MAG: hypothetical protein PW790_00095 [Parvibaculaceae bacterium]|nr:hypothetical protein [Parvibaculaceae bacterium]